MSVPSDEKLYRWLHPSQFKWDEKRPTSAAFKDPYMSVDRSSLTTLSESYERAKTYKKTAVVAILAEIAYKKELEVSCCPTRVLKKDESIQVCTVNSECKSFRDDIKDIDLKVVNPAHACIIGKKTNSISNFFVKNAIVEIYPPNNNE